MKNLKLVGAVISVLFILALAPICSANHHTTPVTPTTPTTTTTIVVPASNIAHSVDTQFAISNTDASNVAVGDANGAASATLNLGAGMVTGIGGFGGGFDGGPVELEIGIVGFSGQNGNSVNSATTLINQINAPGTTTTGTAFASPVNIDESVTVGYRLNNAAVANVATGPSTAVTNAGIGTVFGTGGFNYNQNGNADNAAFRTVGSINGYTSSQVAQILGALP